MTDYKKLCEELRMFGLPKHGEDITLDQRAANAIEELQSDNERLSKKASNRMKMVSESAYKCHELMDDRDRLQAENERLKKACEAKDAIIALNEPTLGIMADAKDTAIRRMWKAEAENERLKQQLDAAVACLEKYMVQDVMDGNEPCDICSKASSVPCEECDPKWRGEDGKA